MNKKIAALAELETGAAPKEVAEKYGVNYNTLLYWRRKEKEKGQTTDSDIDALVKVDPDTLHKLAEDAKKDAPKYVKESVDDIVEGVIGLQQLEPKFHALVYTMLEKASTLAEAEDMTVSDWKALAAGIGALYQGIFNKNTTSVNILNQTNVSNEKLSLFKGSMRA
jgi:transposase